MSRLTKADCISRAYGIYATEGFDPQNGTAQFHHHHFPCNAANMELVRRIVEYGRAQGLAEAAGEEL